MEKTFILDTSVLLYNPHAIYSFDDNLVIIPIEVIEELDSFKKDMSDLGRNARSVIKMLDQLRSEGQLGEGIKLENGGLLRVHAAKCEDVVSRYGVYIGDKFERKLLNLAVHLNELFPDQPSIIITKNMNLRLKADALGIYTEDYEDDRKQNTDYYTGTHSIVVPSGTVEQFIADEKLELPDNIYCPNEYVRLIEEGGDESDEDENVSGVGKIARDGRTLIPLKYKQDSVLGITPLNLEQAFALDALLNDDIKLVTLQGKAGTGKSLLAVAAGLHKVLVEDAYNRVLVSRPTVPMGRDIGFLPGEVEEKMRPWMQPIYDAVEFIRELDRRSRQRALPPDILDSDEIGIEPLTYIRGRSIPHQYMIIDEAQNLTPLEVKTIITRVGRHTKLIMTGDPEQIDNPYIDSMSNGFTSLISKFRHTHLAAHICLTKGERSELAEVAANLL